STLPSDISSTASTMFIKFTSNATVNSTGWMATYITTYANYCSGVTTFTAPSDTFSDGSGIYDYISNTDCRWSLEPSNAATVTLHFTDFNTEPEKDKIRIVDPISSIYLATYSGSSIPADITSYSGQLYIIFSTNSFNNASGWKAYYTSTPLGVTNNDLQNKLTVFPNPAHDKLNISFNLTGKQKVELQFIDITGQVVYSTITNITGVFNKNIDISSLAKGAYLLKVVTSENVITKKFFID
ncbi:MAG: T9SS type A sorting domain-containing protein, partial [Bacteroidetes bacterium]|nr:T9SS type A sorting domain-containing protein [Bacteroidota bacterium]